MLGHISRDLPARPTVTGSKQTTEVGPEPLEVNEANLPGRQFDVMVLRRLCGFTPEAVSALVGASLATVRSDERHATRFVRDVLDTPPSTEGAAP